MIYSPEIVYQSKSEIQFMQEKKLQDLIHYVGEKSPYYKKLFEINNIKSTRIKSIHDLNFIPTTSKEDLQQKNDEFLCVDREKIFEFCSTSGTLGKPVTIALTEFDLKRLAYNEYSSFTCADGSPRDIYQLMLTLDRMFMAGMAYYSGIREMGAGIIRLGPGVPSLQWETILRLRPTAIVGVPTFIIKLIQFAREHKIDINKTSVEKAICIGENIRNNDFTLNVLGKKITEAWNIKLYSTYASTEMQTAFTECSAFKGGHIQPELLILEVLDDDEQHVKAGQPGEVTITTLGVEGMPLLRYKTGDICMYFDEPCSCGRSSLRLSPVVGRKQQKIKYQGTTLYPPALFDILNEIEEVIDFVIEVYSNEMGTDEILLHIIPLNLLEKCDRNIRSNLQARLRVIPQIKYVSLEEIQKMQVTESGRKIVKFVDRRI